MLTFVLYCASLLALVQGAALANAPTVCICGGGPAGSLLALNLCRQGFQVKVLEKRSIQQKISENYLEKNNAMNGSNRSYNFIVFSRGLDALKYGGINEEDIISSAKAARLNGSMRHKPNGEAKFRKPLFGESTWSIARDDLSQILLDDVMEQPNADVRYETEVDSIDFDKNTVIVKKVGDPDDIEQIHYDMLVGADGVNSVVRKGMKDIGWVDVKQDNETHHFVAFKTRSYLYGVKRPDWNQYVHSWKLRDGELLFPPIAEDGMKGVFILPKKFKEMNLLTQDGVLEKYLEETYPNLLNNMPNADRTELLEVLKASKPSLTTSTMVSKLNAQNVVVIGDAAHSMSAALGQGVNCALEDCTVLDNCLKESGALLTSPALERMSESELRSFRQMQLTQALENFNIQRLADVHGAVKLSSKGIDKANDRSVRKSYIMKIAILSLLNKTLGRIFPAIFPQLALSQLNDPNVRYGTIWQSVQSENKRAKSIRNGLCVTFLLSVLKYGSRHVSLSLATSSMMMGTNSDVLRVVRYLSTLPLRPLYFVVTGFVLLNMFLLRQRQST